MAPSIANQTFSILIVGGGIAGLASAIALRGPGRSILILEQSSLNREIGAVISLQPNASKIVEKEWGLGSVLKAKGSMIDTAFRICSTDGIERTRIDLTAKVEYGGDRVVYHRQDLHEVLKAAATSQDGPGSAAVIRTSSRAISCDCEAGSVLLENGERLDGFDLIVGADGIRSSLRKSVLGREVAAVTTGVSVYRMMIKTSEVSNDLEIMKFLDPQEPCTTMVMSHDCRLIMGPARAGQLYSIVAMVPDNNMNESTTDNSWTSQGDRSSILESFKDFPEWCKRLFGYAPELGLWQLRDLDPLEKWVSGRTILIGDASHAMLPLQGQGASQSIEDAEALGALFADIKGKIPKEKVNTILKEIEGIRKPRATIIQACSRESAKPATEKGDTKIKLRTDQHMDYNCTYNGAKDWQLREKILINDDW